MEKKVVLIVDDDPDIRTILVEELEAHGYATLKANDGVEGFKIVQNEHIDCIISDIRMPGGDGVELVKAVKKLDKSIPIFLVTGFSDYTGEELNLIGVSAIIFKPFDLEEVREMINTHLAKIEKS